MGGRNVKFKSQTIGKATTLEKLGEKATALLDACLDAANGALENGQGTPALMRESSTVARAIAVMQSEQRQRKRDEQKARRDLSVVELLECYRQLDENERAHVRAEMDHIDRSDGRLF